MKNLTRPRLFLPPMARSLYIQFRARYSFNAKLRRIGKPHGPIWGQNESAWMCHVNMPVINSKGTVWNFIWTSYRRVSTPGTGGTEKWSSNKSVRVLPWIMWCNCTLRDGLLKKDPPCPVMIICSYHGSISVHHTRNHITLFAAITSEPLSFCRRDFVRFGKRTPDYVFYKCLYST